MQGSNVLSHFLMAETAPKRRTEGTSYLYNGQRKCFHKNCQWWIRVDVGWSDCDLF